MRYTSGVNPFLSRKTYNCVCEWWSRSTFNGQIPLYKLATENVPSGKFHAKAVSPFMYNTKLGGDVRVSNGYVTIESPDDLSFVRANDIVTFQGIIYRIENISKREVTKTREFMRHPISVYVLQLMR